MIDWHESGEGLRAQVGRYEVYVLRGMLVDWHAVVVADGRLVVEWQTSSRYGARMVAEETIRGLMGEDVQLDWIDTQRSRAYEGTCDGRCVWIYEDYGIGFVEVRLYNGMERMLRDDWAVRREETNIGHAMRMAVRWLLFGEYEEVEYDTTLS